MVRRYERLFPRPQWADMPEQGQEDSTTRLFTSTNSILAKRPAVLRPDTISITRERDGNFQNYHNTGVSSVEFHRNSQILMTASRDHTLRFFSIDGRENPLLQNIKFRNFPITKAQFMPDGNEVVAISKRPFFFTYNVEMNRVTQIPGLSGSAGFNRKSMVSHMRVSKADGVMAFSCDGGEGLVALVSGKTKQVVGRVRMNGTVRALEFSDDGKYLFTAGGKYLVLTSLAFCILFFKY
jgi:U3 small nucleolar RNA-associated protein 18